MWLHFSGEASPEGVPPAQLHRYDLRLVDSVAADGLEGALGAAHNRYERGGGQGSSACGLRKK